MSMLINVRQYVPDTQTPRFVGRIEMIRAIPRARQPASIPTGAPFARWANVVRTGVFTLLGSNPPLPEHGVWFVNPSVNTGPADVQFIERLRGGQWHPVLSLWGVDPSNGFQAGMHGEGEVHRSADRRFRGRIEWRTLVG